MLPGSPTLLIRPYDVRDAEPLWQLLAPAIQAGEYFALPVDMSQGEAVADWSGGDHHCYIALQEGQVVGSYYVRPNQRGGGAHVANAGYATLPSARGRGVARAMCLHSLETAAQLGFRSMQFNFVLSSNHAAIALWQACGFSTVGRLTEAFLHPRLGYIDALIMARRC